MGKALPGVHLFRQCSHKKPLQGGKMATRSLFMAVGSGFDKNHNQTPSEKGLFFWFVFFGQTKKMNKTLHEPAWGLKYTYRNNTLLEDVNDAMFKFEKRLGRYCPNINNKL